MAGGMDWFRSYHGTVNDPKFRVVARKAGARVTEALAMWQTLLEQASSAQDRGNPGSVDYEAIELSLDMTEGTARALHEAFKARGMIDAETGRIARWETRQPRREDDSAADRKRRQRERDAETVTQPPVESHVVPQGHDEVTQADAASRRVTQSHAEIESTGAMSRSVTQRHARGEEKRGEEKEQTPPPQPPERGACPVVRDSGADPPADDPDAADDDYPPDFLRFWEECPRKVGKGAALKAWRKLRPSDAKAERITAAMVAQRDNPDWHREAMRYAPHPSKWLNDKRFDDAPAAPGDLFIGSSWGRTGNGVAL